MADDGWVEVPNTNGGLLKKILREASGAACSRPALLVNSDAPPTHALSLAPLL